MNTYGKQSRPLGEYYQNMDASMVTKVGPTIIHLLSKEGGKIVDMGTGSGDAVSTYARLFQDSSITGVDINPESIMHCKSTYTENNAHFIEGDVEDMLFEENSIDAILNSSTLHHVSSFNNYSKKHIETSILNQIKQLKDDGIFIIRDFVIPDENKEVILELSTTPGVCKCTGNNGCVSEYCIYSDAELFEIFSKGARSLHSTPGFPMMEVTSNEEKTKRFKVSHRNATEFVLRKDYRQEWEVELQEEYTYFTQNEFEDIFRKNGMRILTSYPYHNPWILKNRFKDKFIMYDDNGNRIDYPATNHIIVGQKISPTSQYGNIIREKSKEILSSKESFSFLTMKTSLNTETQEIYNIAERLGMVQDIFPFSIDKESQEISVSVKWGYPRPLLGVETIEIDKKRYDGFICEPHSISMQAEQKDISDRSGIDSENLGKTIPGLKYFTSPGIVGEYVESVFIESSDMPKSHAINAEISGFSHSGESRSMRANDILRASQTGTMPEARLEMNLYFLFKQLGKTPDKWIGDEVDIQACSIPKSKIIDISKITTKIDRKTFEPIDSVSGNYLEHYRSRFEEVLSIGNSLKELGENTLEYVVPRNSSTNVISALPVIHNSKDDTLYVGLELQDFPTVQDQNGSSALWCVPAYRLPKEVDSYVGLERFNKKKISDSPLQKIGESYKPSIGITPETVYPYIHSGLSRGNNISYVPFTDLLDNIHTLQDTHLIIALLRLDHILQSKKQD